MKGGELGYAEGPGFAYTNPYWNLSNSGPTDRVLTMIYEPLFRYNFQSEEWEPILAEAIKKVAAKKGGRSAFAVTLRRGVSWHDGMPFTAQDVLFTYAYIQRMAANKQLRDATAEKLVDVRQGQDVSEIIFEFKRSEPEPRVQLLDFIVPAHRFNPKTLDPISPDKDLNQEPLGTGPWKFERFYKGMATLVAFDGYWGDRPHLDRVRGSEFADQQAKVEALLVSGGNVNLVVEVPPDQLPKIENSGSAVIKALPSYKVWVLAMRQKAGSVLTDERARKAITLALDRTKLLKNWFGGQGEVLASPVTPTGPGYDPSLKPLPFDAQQARRDLVATGAAGKKLRLVYLTGGESGTDTRTQNVVKSIKEALEDVGLVVIDKPLKGKEFESTVFGSDDWDLVYTRWEYNPSYDLSAFFKSSNAVPGGYNYMNFNDPETDRLLKAYDDADDSGLRLSMMKQLQRRLAEKAPATFLFSETSNFAVQNKYVLPQVDVFYFFTYANKWYLKK